MLIVIYPVCCFTVLTCPCDQDICFILIFLIFPFYFSTIYFLIFIFFNQFFLPEISLAMTKSVLLISIQSNPLFPSQEMSCQNHFEMSFHPNQIVQSGIPDSLWDQSIPSVQGNRKFPKVLFVGTAGPRALYGVGHPSVL